MKLESLVIADQHAAVNTFPGLSLIHICLGVPVIAVGAPTVVDGATLALDLLAQAGQEALGHELLGGKGIL